MHGSTIGNSPGDIYRTPYEGLGLAPRSSLPGIAPAPGRAPGDNFGITPFWNSAAAFGTQGTSASPGGLTAIFAMFSNFVQALFAQIVQYMQQLGGSAPQGADGENGRPPPPQRWFSDVQADSIGDPHDSVAGTATGGAAISEHWDDQQSHRDLLTSDSFPGGYRVATRVTPASANGVTMNASASVVTDRGQTAVSYRSDGTFDVRSHGAEVGLIAGQPADLGNGETVTLNADGSLQIAMANANGGVNVENHASNVMLGGYLIGRIVSPPPISGPQW